MKKSFFLIVLSLGLFDTLSAQESQSTKKVNTIIEHLNTKNSDALLRMMADSARIGNLPVMDNSKVVPEILSKFNSITDFSVSKQERLPNGDLLISLGVTYQDGKEGKPTFTFNKKGDIVNLGIIKARLTGNPERALADAKASAIQPDTVQIPFQMMNGLIYVPAKLNNQQGYFMFDSGAPVLILRKKYISEAHISKDVSVDFTGMGGMMQDVKWATGNTLDWGGIQLNDLDAPVASMDDMELENGVPIFGLMGYGILKGYQLTFDYGKQLLLLEKVDEQGNLTGTQFAKGEILSSSAMRMKRHIPIVDVLVDGAVYPMGIDCGANANVIKVAAAEVLAEHMDYDEEQVSINGVGGSAQNNKVGFLMHSSVGDVDLEDMYTAVTDQMIGGGTGDQALPIVGLLGTPFLIQYKMTLNFNKGEISFYKK